MKFVKNNNILTFSDPELEFRYDEKRRRNTLALLKKYGVNRKTRNILVGDAGFRGVQEIYDCPEEALISIKGIGWKSLQQIRQKLLPYFLKFVR